jgi:hypothetical protein
MSANLDASGRGYAFVAFFHICNVATMASDRLSWVVRRFDQALGRAAQDSVEIFRSPWGGGMVVWDRIVLCLEITQKVISLCASDEIRLAVGLHEGRAAQVDDVIGHNLGTVNK